MKINRINVAMKINDCLEKYVNRRRQKYLVSSMKYVQSYKKIDKKIDKKKEKIDLNIQGGW